MLYAQRQLGRLNSFINHYPISIQTLGPPYTSHEINKYSYDMFIMVFNCILLPTLGVDINEDDEDDDEDFTHKGGSQRIINILEEESDWQRVKEAVDSVAECGILELRVIISIQRNVQLFCSLCPNYISARSNVAPRHAAVHVQEARGQRDNASPDGQPGTLGSPPAPGGHVQPPHALGIQRAVRGLWQ